MAEIKTTELELVIGNDDPDAVAGPEILENFQKIDDAIVVDRRALAEKYSRPPTGIPRADLEQAVRDTLNLAEEGLGENRPKVERDELDDDVQASLAKADTAVQQVQSVNVVISTGSSESLPDVADAQQHHLTLTAACELEFPAPVAGKSFVLVLAQDATGSRLVTWPASVKWPGGAAPTLSTGASKVDYFRFYCVDGTTWAGFVMGLDVR